LRVAYSLRSSANIVPKITFNSKNTSVASALTTYLYSANGIATFYIVCFENFADEIPAFFDMIRYLKRLSLQ